MDNIKLRDIKRQRMMQYFINSAKEIIEEEGVNSLSVRKVGKRAGYSYATIYNYFKDINMLLIYCAFDYLEDCYNYMISLNINASPIDKLIQYAKKYFIYFSKRADIFNLIFVKNLGRIPDDLLADNKPSLSILMKDCLLDCVSAGYLNEKDIDLIGELITSSIHGKLVFYLKNDNLDTREFLDAISKEISYIIK